MFILIDQILANAKQTKATKQSIELRLIDRRRSARVRATKE